MRCFVSVVVMLLCVVMVGETAQAAQVLALNKQYTHSSWHHYPPVLNQPANWSSPHNYKGGRIEIRAKVTRITTPIRCSENTCAFWTPQLCLEQGTCAYCHSCSDPTLIRVNKPGTYYGAARTPGQEFDWTKPFYRWRVAAKGDTPYDWSCHSQDIPIHLSVMMIAEGSTFDIPDWWYDNPVPLEAPVLDPAPGTYAEGFKVTVTNMKMGTQIFYTLYGDEPTWSSKRYTGYINVFISRNIKVRVMSTTQHPSDIVEAVYTINPTGITLGGSDFLAKTYDIKVISSPVPGTRFSLYEPKQVNITVYDLQGKLVAVLADTRLGAGDHQIEWNDRDAKAGIYTLGVTIGKGNGFFKLMNAPAR